MWPLPAAPQACGSSLALCPGTWCPVLSPNRAADPEASVLSVHLLMIALSSGKLQPFERHRGAAQRKLIKRSCSCVNFAAFH